MKPKNSEVAMEYTLAFLLLLSGSAIAAEHPVEMEMQCQQNLSDGRILISNGNMLPENSRYRVKLYKPQSQEGAWSYGPCTLVMTKGVSG